MTDNTFHEVRTSFEEDRVTNGLTIQRHQTIPDELISSLREQREGNARTVSGNFLHVAAVPEAVVIDLKVNYGFDVLTEPVSETVKMLKRYALDYFLATNKSI